MRRYALLWIVAVALPICALAQDSAPFVVTEVPPPPPGGRWTGRALRAAKRRLAIVEIHGLSAGRVSARFWEKNQLHWVPDVRMPILAPRMGGVFRNIYAPSAVEEG